MKKLNVIYEDNHIIVVEKIVNVPTQEDSSKDIDMCAIVKEYIKEKYNKPGDVFLGIVHRLDRPVGGIMVFAKTSKGASRISEEIRTGRFKKQYLAVLDGELDEKEGTLKDYLLKNEEKNIVRVVSKDTRGAKEAILDYEVLQAINNKTLVKVNLHTGRSHQIRVQFANIGHPLTGDVKYGMKIGKDIALWAYRIEFKHPVKEEILTFTLKPKTELFKMFDAISNLC